MEIHKKFSIPVACFVFALIGLALGATNRKDGKLASFVIGIGVIFVYYVVMFMAQAMTKGYIIPAWLSMWLPNIVLGVAGVFLLIRRARYRRPADSHLAAAPAIPRLADGWWRGRPLTRAGRHPLSRRRRPPPHGARAATGSWS